MKNVQPQPGEVAFSRSLIMYAIHVRDMGTLEGLGYWSWGFWSVMGSETWTYW